MRLGPSTPAPASRRGGGGGRWRRLLLAAAWAGGLGRGQAGALPEVISTTDDVFNQQVFIEYFSQAYYKDRFSGVLPAEQRQELLHLAAAADGQPSLAMAAAHSLYMFGWYAAPRGVPALEATPAEGVDSTSEAAGGEVAEAVVDWRSAAAAAALFERSLLFGGCTDPEMSLKDFIEARSCDTRWSHAVALHAYLAQGGPRADATGEAEELEPSREEHGRRAEALLAGLLGTVRFGGGCCGHWRRPLDFNFNAVFFPEAFSAPVWPRHRHPPLAAFVEEHFPTFREELLPLLAVPRDDWVASAPGAITAEHLASRNGWFMLAIVRHGEWNDLLCRFAPRTCELLAARPEIVNCTVSNSNVMWLAPGAAVKPHFGNAPRLSLHLPLQVPEPEAAWMQVGHDLVSWREGEALVFDDTFAHSVGHRGRRPRTVLSAWFCHPCDGNALHQHGQACVT